MARWARTASIVVVFVIAFAYTLLACGRADLGDSAINGNAGVVVLEDASDDALRAQVPELRNATCPTKNGPILAMNSDVCRVFRIACTRCESG